MRWLDVVLSIAVAVVVAAPPAFAIGPVAGRGAIPHPFPLELLRQIESKVTTAPTPARRSRAAASDPAPRRVLLAVGHGRRADGGVTLGARHPDGAVEMVVNEVVVRAMTERLRTHPGLEVVSEAGTDHPDVEGTAARTRREHFDDCIEVHHEWVGAPPGAFAAWHPSSGRGRLLADAMVAELDRLGIQIRRDWHRPHPQLKFVRRTRCTAVLVEVGRVGDYSPEELPRIGVALAEGYLRYLAR